GTAVRDELFGSPEELGREINPVGEIVSINHQPFTVVGMFQHYESDKDRRERDSKKPRSDSQTAAKSGPRRSRGWSGMNNNWVYYRKNNTVYIPLNTMWLRFRAATGTNDVPDPTLSDLDLKVASLEQLEPALQQARNVMMLTHRGIEDFSFRTQENSVDNINTTIRIARRNGGLIAAIS